jgi:hypothetical protein
MRSGDDNERARSHSRSWPFKLGRRLVGTVAGFLAGRHDLNRKLLRLGARLWKRAMGGPRAAIVKPERQGRCPAAVRASLNSS